MSGILVSTDVSRGEDSGEAIRAGSLRLRGVLFRDPNGIVLEIQILGSLFRVFLFGVLSGNATEKANGSCWQDWFRGVACCVHVVRVGCAIDVLGGCADDEVGNYGSGRANSSALARAVSTLFGKSFVEDSEALSNELDQTKMRRLD